jgi:hypothetical protein
MWRRIVALVVALTSCGAYRSSSGELVVSTLDHEEVAAREAAARDIPCEVGKIIVVTWVAPMHSSRDLIVVEGCGQRLSYVCKEEHCELFARLQR